MVFVTVPETSVDRDSDATHKGRCNTRYEPRT